MKSLYFSHCLALVVSLMVGCKPQQANPPAFHTWLKIVEKLPRDEQVKAVEAKFKELNPHLGEQWTITPLRSNGFTGEIIGVEFIANNVTDISPIQALGWITDLGCAGFFRDRNSGQRAKLSDLSPLKGLQLTGLDCNDTNVADLTFLNEMRLESLDVSGTLVSDLTPIEKMHLKMFSCKNSNVDAAPPLARRGLGLKPDDP